MGLECVLPLLVVLMILVEIFRKDTKKRSANGSRISTPRNLPNYLGTEHSHSDNIQDYGINDILSSGKFTSAERAAEYRRRGKSPSGVIDGVYNDAYRANGSYNDSYRDWDANA